jgi:hypothetical protein
VAAVEHVRFGSLNVEIDDVDPLMRDDRCQQERAGRGGSFPRAGGVHSSPDGSESFRDLRAARDCLSVPSVGLPHVEPNDTVFCRDGGEQELDVLRAMSLSSMYCRIHWKWFGSASTPTKKYGMPPERRSAAATLTNQLPPTCAPSSTITNLARASATASSTASHSR